MAVQKDSGIYPYALAAILIIILGAELIIGTAQQKAGTYIAPAQNLSFVEVSAIGYAYGTPSQALIYITVNGSGNTSTNAVSSLASTLEVLNSTLIRYVNGNVSQIQTDSLSVYMQSCPYYTTIYPQGQSTSPACNQTRYDAQEQVAITLLNVSKVGQFVGSVSEIPSVLVDSVNAKLSSNQTVALRDSALKSALANATSQASVLANGSRLTLTNVSVSSFYAYPLGMIAASGAARSSSPAFYLGRYQISETVTAQFSYNR